jgi:outer membrane protein insertion porin family
MHRKPREDALGMRKLLATVAMCTLPAVSYAAQEISTIEVRGTNRISKDTVLSYLKVKVGQELNQQLSEQTIHSLYDTGFFEDVSLRQEGSKLIVQVRENPIIAQINFHGNKAADKQGLQSAVSMGERSVFSKHRMLRDINNIRMFYQKKGFYSVRIEPKKEVLDANRINLVYDIAEGEPAAIRRIYFIGNKKMSGYKLRGQLLSKQTHLLSFIFADDVYDNSKVMYDQQLLTKFYRNEGYADFKINSVATELSPARDHFYITYDISEGKRYKFGQINFKSQIEGIDSSDLQKLIDFKSNTTFSEDALEKTVDKLVDYLGHRGYAFADVDYKFDTDTERGLANVTFLIKKTYRAYVNRINIKNNSKTLDRVIRREFRLSEGDPYNTTKLRRSEQRLRKLGFFRNVDIENKRTSEHDKVDIDVSVTEQSTGSIRFGAGYSSADGPLGEIYLSENNFLGKGQRIGLQLQRAKKRSEARISFTEPYFLEKPISASIETFGQKQDVIDEKGYKRDTVGMSVGMGYDLTEHLSHSIKYTLRKDRIRDVDDKASIYIKDEEGKKNTSMLSHSLIYDKLDNFLDPAEGYLLRFNQAFAGLGGDAKYMRHTVSGIFYTPVVNKNFIFSLSGRLTHVFDWGNYRLGLNDKIYMGPDEVRGFETAGIGPRADSKEREALGGDLSYSASAELSFPIDVSNDMGMKGFIFYDMGALIDTKLKKGVDDLPHGGKDAIFFDKGIRMSYGFGIKFSPALGHIRLEYGIPLKRRDYDKVERFRISFGTRF